jgi:hypothetical protein
VLGVAAVVFVATNPHLYPNPWRHTQHLFDNRSTVMDIQRGEYPQWAAGNLAQRLSYVAVGSVVLRSTPDYGDTAVWRGLPLAAGLAPLGTLALLLRARTRWRERRQLATDLLVVGTALVYFAGVTVTIHMYWPRYLVPTILFASLLAGVGLQALVEWVRAWRRDRRRVATT